MMLSQHLRRLGWIMSRYGLQTSTLQRHTGVYATHNAMLFQMLDEL